MPDSLRWDVREEKDTLWPCRTRSGKIKATYQVVEIEEGQPDKVVSRWSSQACARRDAKRFAERAREMGLIGGKK